MIWKVGLGVVILIVIIFVYSLCRIAAESDRRMQEMFKNRRA